jgi:hypothetical protein
MGITIFKAAFLATGLVATGGWVWLLYAGFSWILKL